MEEAGTFKTYRRNYDGNEMELGKNRKKLRMKWD